MNKNFTEEEVIKAAREKYGKPVSTDLIKDAMDEPTLEEAVEVIIIDSAYWDDEW